MKKVSLAQKKKMSSKAKKQLLLYPITKYDKHHEGGQTGTVKQATDGSLQGTIG